MGDFCDEVCEIHKNEKTLAVAHAGTIDAVFRWTVCIHPRQPWAFEIEVPNASISEIQVWPIGIVKDGPPSHAVIHRIDDNRHLGEWSSPQEPR